MREQQPLLIWAFGIWLVGSPKSRALQRNLMQMGAPGEVNW